MNNLEKEKTKVFLEGLGFDFRGEKIKPSKNKLSELDSEIIEDYKKGSILMEKVGETIDILKKVEFRDKVPGIINEGYVLYNSIFYEFVQPFYKRFK